MRGCLFQAMKIAALALAAISLVNIGMIPRARRVSVPVYFHFIFPTKEYSVAEVKIEINQQINMLNAAFPDHRVTFYSKGFEIAINQADYFILTGSAEADEMVARRHVPGSVNIYRVSSLSVIFGILGETYADSPDTIIYGPIPNITTVHEMGHALGLDHSTINHNGCRDLMEPYDHDDECTFFSLRQENKIILFVKSAKFK